MKEDSIQEMVSFRSHSCLWTLILIYFIRFLTQQGIHSCCSMHPSGPTQTLESENWGLDSSNLWEEIAW